MMSNTAKAFLISPLVPVAVFCLMALYDHAIDPESVSLQQLGLAVGGIVIFGSVVSYALAGAFAFPLYLTFKNLGILSWKTIIPSATLLGCLIVFILNIWPYIGEPSSSASFSYYGRGCEQVIDNVLTQCGLHIALVKMLKFGALGAFTGLVFWWIYARGDSPNKDAA